MQASADLWAVEPPPESGVRRIAPRAVAPAPQHASAPLPSSPAILADVGKQVFLEVLDLTLALSPLQGAWFKIGFGEIGAIAVKVLGWELSSMAAPPGARTARLRARWTELVPGYAAMDHLVGLMVDLLCGPLNPVRRRARGGESP